MSLSWDRGGRRGNDEYKRAKAIFAVPHNLGNPFAVVQVYRAIAPFSLVAVEVEATTQDEVTVQFASPPQPGEYMVVVIG